MKKIRVICILLVVALAMTSQAFAFDSAVIIRNCTGHTITEIYIFPEYSKSMGKMRNNGYVYSGDDCWIDPSAAELDMECEWTIRIYYDRTKYWEWYDIDLWKLYGQCEHDVYIGSDGKAYLEARDDRAKRTNFDIEAHEDQTLTILNYTGQAISEIYIYPTNSSTLGKCRNTRWVYNGSSVTFVIPRSESSANQYFDMTICFSEGVHDSVMAYFQKIPYDTVLGKEMNLTRTGENSWWWQVY